MKKLVTTLLFAITTSLSATSLEPPSSFFLGSETFDIYEDESLSFIRPNFDEEGIFYFNIAYFTVDTDGLYKASNSAITFHNPFGWDYQEQQQNAHGQWYAADPYIYIYENSFNPQSPSLNLIGSDDDGYDGGNDVQFEISLNLEADVDYYAVITTYDPGENDMEGVIDIYGPQGASYSMTIIPEPATYGLILGCVALLLRRYV